MWLGRQITPLPAQRDALAGGRFFGPGMIKLHAKIGRESNPGPENVKNGNSEHNTYLRM